MTVTEIELTPREAETMRVLRAAGKATSAYIAETMHVSESRARNYLGEIRMKGVPIECSHPHGRNDYAEYWLGDEDEHEAEPEKQHRGVKEADKPIIVRIPKIAVREYRPITDMPDGDPETMVVLLSDLHAGEITESYNAAVFRARMHTLLDSILVITHLHRHMYPINDIVVIDLGDNVHGENPYQGAKIGSVECGAFDQIFKIAMPELISFLASLKQEFVSVRFYGVRGNHGRSKLAPETSNLDLLLYRALEGVSLPDGIGIEYSEDFKLIVPVRGFRFFAFHGDQVQSNYGVPYYGIYRKLNSWYQQYDGFNYSCCGHWHKTDFLRLSKNLKHFMNGSLATDDPFSLEKIGQSALPVQTCFGVHERKGVTWVYELVTDKNYFPVKININGAK